MGKPYTFAQRLQEIMAERDLSKSDLARICEINKSNMTRYCNGEYEAKQDVVYKMASRLGINAAWLMGYDVPKEFKLDLQFFTESQEKDKPVETDGLTDKQREFIRLVSQLSDQEVSMLSAQVKGLLQSQGSRDDA